VERQLRSSRLIQGGDGIEPAGQDLAADVVADLEPSNGKAAAHLLDSK
jgi:hypothetical protein